MVMYNEPRNVQNFDSPSLLVEDLSKGLESNIRLTNLSPGSASELINFNITESGTLEAITHYSQLCSHTTDDGRTIKKIKSLPIEFTGSDLIGSSNNVYTRLFFIAVLSDNSINIVSTSINSDVVVELEINTAGEFSKFFKALLVDSKIMFYNGVNEPFLYDCHENKVIEYHKLEDPTAVPTSATNMPGSTDVRDFLVSYTVAFESTIGGTKASPIGTRHVGKLLVDMDSNEYFRIYRGDIPTGAVSWNAYISISSGADEGAELFRFTADPIPLTQDYIDFTKQSIIRIDDTSPDDNTTEGPIFDYAKLINSRIWVANIGKMGGKVRPYRVAWSGTGRYVHTFGASHGAGYVDIEHGGPNKVQAVAMFRKNDGTPAINVLTGAPQTKGKRFTMEPQALSLGSADQNNGGLQTFVPVEQTSIMGTTAPGSVVNTDASLVYLSSQGLISTQTNPSTYGVLMNNVISLKIKPIIDSAVQSRLGDVESRESSNKVYWLLFNKTNSFILYFDYIKNAYGLIDIPAEHIFNVESAEDTDIKIGFILNNKLWLFDGEEVPITSKVTFNYVNLSRARTRVGYGRLLDSFINFEHIGTGRVKLRVNGVSKDDIILSGNRSYRTAKQSEMLEFPFYKAHVQLYRDRIITDKASITIESTGLNYSLVGWGVTFNAVQVDYNKNKFGRSKRTSIDRDVITHAMLQPQSDFGKYDTGWEDSIKWDDSLVWDDGKDA